MNNVRSSEELFFLRFVAKGQNLWGNSMNRFIYHRCMATVATCAVTMRLDIVLILLSNSASRLLSSRCCVSRMTISSE